MKAKKPVKKAGRPPINLDETFTKIKPFLQLGYKLHKACLYALIPYTTVKPYYDKNDDFRNKIERERTLVNTVARKNLVKAIQDGDLKASLDWLETQEKDEFSKRQEVKDVTPEDEGLKLLQELVQAKKDEKRHIKPIHNK